jgi:hypothetical protein
VGGCERARQDAESGEQNHPDGTGRWRRSVLIAVALRLATRSATVATITAAGSGGRLRDRQTPGAELTS